MKKVVKGIFVVMFAAVIISGGFLFTNNFIPKSGEVVQLSLDEVEHKFKRKESFIVVITSKTCKYCVPLVDILNDYVKDNPHTIYELSLSSQDNLSNYTSEDIVEFFPSYIGTPNIFYVENGKIISQYDNMNGKLNLDLFSMWVKKYLE